MTDEWHRRLEAWAGALLLPLAAWTGSSAAADSVTLSCRGNSGSAITLRVDYAGKRVEMLGADGKAFTNRTATNATISDNAIVWRAELMDTGLQKPRPMIWEGQIDRLSGSGWETWSRAPDWAQHRNDISCTQASQKF